MPTDQLLFWRALSIISSLAVRVPIHYDLIDTLRRFFVELQKPYSTRIVEAMLEDHVVTETYLLGLQGPGRVGAALDRLFVEQPMLGAAVDSSPTTRRGLLRQASAVGLALVGVSLAIMADGITSLGAMLGVLAGICAGWAWGRL